MRISVDRDDVGYRPDAHKFTVTIDGIRLGGCVTADEELGLAVCHVHDRETGFMVADARRPGRFARDTIYGKVAITKPKDVTNVP